MADNNSIEIGKLLKEALKIVDELGNMDIDEIENQYDDELDKIEKLIKRAQILKKNRLFKLT